MIVLFKGTKPTYGELIDIFERLDGQPNAPDMLSAEITKRYPGLSVSRPSRLYDTVKRIAGPTLPSLHGAAKLTGSPLASYRKRNWEPRIRNPGININNVSTSIF